MSPGWVSSSGLCLHYAPSALEGSSQILCAQSLIQALERRRLCETIWLQGKDMEILKYVAIWSKSSCRALILGTLYSIFSLVSNVVPYLSLSFLCGKGGGCSQHYFDVSRHTLPKMKAILKAHISSRRCAKAFSLITRVGEANSYCASLSLVLVTVMEAACSSLRFQIARKPWSTALQTLWHMFRLCSKHVSNILSYFYLTEALMSHMKHSTQSTWKNAASVSRSWVWNRSLRTTPGNQKRSLMDANTLRHDQMWSYSSGNVQNTPKIQKKTQSPTQQINFICRSSLRRTKILPRLKSWGTTTWVSSGRHAQRHGLNSTCPTDKRATSNPCA